MRVAITGGTAGLGLALVQEFHRRGAVILNVISDAAINPYPQWGAYGASKAALLHLSRIRDAELAEEGIGVLALDPGDMDTELHATALPDSDPASLKRPETAPASWPTRSPRRSRTAVCAGSVPSEIQDPNNDARKPSPPAPA